MALKMTFLWKESFWSCFPLGPEKASLESHLSHIDCFAIHGPVAPSADRKIRTVNSGTSSPGKN